LRRKAGDMLRRAKLYVPKGWPGVDNLIQARVNHLLESQLGGWGWMLGIYGRTRCDSRSGCSRGGLVLGRLDERHDSSRDGGRLEGGVGGREGNLVLLEL
jgi:hypothetical protein